MNAKQRIRLSEALDIITQIFEEEEEEKIDNMSDSFGETEKFQQMEEKKD